MIQACRSAILFVAALTAASGLNAQYFMRAYGGIGSIYNPPNFYMASFGAAVLPSGYMMTHSNGLAWTVDDDGAPLVSARLRRAAAPNAPNLRLYKVETDGTNAFYYAEAGTDSMAVVKTSSGWSIAWQSGIVGTPSGEELLPTGDGGCALLYRVGPSGFQRAALARYNTDGSVLWHKAYRIAGNGAPFTARGIARTANGGYLVCGRHGAGSNAKPYVMRLAADGSVSWAREVTAGNGGNAEGLAVTELPNGNVRVALLLPQPGMYLGMVDLSSSGATLDSWGYSGTGFSVGRIRFGADGSAYCTGGNDGKVFRLAPDGAVVFAQEQLGPPNTYMLCQALLPKSDGTQVMLGNYTTNPFANSVPVLYASGPQGALPAPFSTPYSIAQAAYSATLAALSPSDSLLTGLMNPQLEFASAPQFRDTLFGTPTSVEAIDDLEAALRIQPNPASDAITVDLEEGFNASEVRVSDLKGQLLLAKRQAITGRMGLDIRALGSGTYLIEVIGPRGRCVGRFTKE